jgi:hypothetical protein
MPGDAFAMPSQQGFGCDDPALPLSAGERCGDGSEQSPVVIVEYRSVRGDVGLFTLVGVAWRIGLRDR